MNAVDFVIAFYLLLATFQDIKERKVREGFIFAVLGLVIASVILLHYSSIFVLLSLIFSYSIYYFILRKYIADADRMLSTFLTIYFSNNLKTFFTFTFTSILFVFVISLISRKLKTQIPFTPYIFLSFVITTLI